jgi:hypothetical protein
MKNYAEQKSEAEAIGELKSIFEKKYRAIGLIKASGIVKDFTDQLKNEYGESSLQETKLFHILSLSSIDDELSPKFDLFDGRIERFIREEI